MLKFCAIVLFLAFPVDLNKIIKFSCHNFSLQFFLFSGDLPIAVPFLFLLDFSIMKSIYYKRFSVVDLLRRFQKGDLKIKLGYGDSLLKY